MMRRKPFLGDLEDRGDPGDLGELDLLILPYNLPYREDLPALALSKYVSKYTKELAGGV